LAGFEEIERLLSMKARRDQTPEECEKGMHLSTRSVYDWRYRGQQWRRRCRFVAREFKAVSENTAETFAPTSGVGSRLILLMHICYGWCLSFLDIKDAFLLLLQQERVLVSMPPWWKPETHVEGADRFWILERGLPGQRNAAARLFNFLAKHL
jgi:hypothetical protein